jgi:small ligand-binding sensory domain FIST
MSASNTFAAACSEHPVASEGVGEIAGAILDGLGGERPDLLVTFVSPHFAGTFEDIAATLQRTLEPGLLFGGTAVAVIGGAHEVEDSPAISAWAARLPETNVTPVDLRTLRGADGTIVSGWPGEAPGDTLLLLADPFSLPIDGFLRQLGDAIPQLQVIGGMASAAAGPGGNRLTLDGGTQTDGAVGALLDGGPPVRSVLSQGCRPIGSAFIVTEVEGPTIRSLGGRPPLERLQQIAASMSQEERELLGSGLHVGIAVDEHRGEFKRGDFLVRNVVGANREDGAIAVGAEVEVGQTLQFHVRDADAADEDLRELLAGERADAALLFTCTGRGRRLFGTDDHDAGVVSSLLGPVPVAGMFCAGELGPVSGANHVHGFTASLALFRA